MVIRTKTVLFALCLTVWGVLFAGCTPHTDYFAPMQGDFSAEVAGEMNGVEFSAQIESRNAPEGGREVTVTFYAPEGLADTVAKRASDGSITLSAGEVTVSAVPAGITPIFDLFPTGGEVKDVVLTEDGHTKVTGDGFSVTFLSDGTPYSLENGNAKVTVVRFTAG